jgi:hypothetical protein
MSDEKPKQREQEASAPGVSRKKDPDAYARHRERAEGVKVPPLGRRPTYRIPGRDQ